MTCPVCALDPTRRKLIERLYSEGKTVDELGQSFRIDYDELRAHLTEHVKSEEEGFTDKTEELLDDLDEMITSAKNLVNSEEDAANYGAYTNLVKLYHTMNENYITRQKEEQAERLKAEVLADTLVANIINPLLVDVGKLVLTEIARLREAVKHSGNLTEATDRQFQEMTRRLGNDIQGSIDPLMETLRQTVGIKPEKKSKKK